MVRQKRVVDLDFVNDVTLCLVMKAMMTKIEEVTHSFGINISAMKNELLFIALMKVM